MARPTKQGIDYFPLDVQFDDKIELFVIETGSVGFSVLVSTWQLIYSNEGYYIDCTKDLFLLLKKRLMVDIDVSESIIEKAINRKIFNVSLYKEHKILTSKAIQKRYFDAAKRKKIVMVNKNHLLVDVSAYNNISYNGLNVGKNATNVNVKEDVNVDKEKINKKEKKKNLGRDGY